MNKLGVVVQEVYRKNVKTGGFLVMVFSPIVFFAIFAVIGFFLGRDAAGTNDATIALVSDQPSVTQVLTQLQEPKFIEVSSQEAAQAELKDDKVDGYLVVTRPQGQLTATYYSRTTDKKVQLNAVHEVLDQVNLANTQAELGLTSDQVAAIEQARVVTSTQEIKFDTDGKAILAEDAAAASKQELERIIQRGAAYFVGILIFMFITTYSGIISQEVAGEKGTRIMEVILSSMSASTHFYGKLIGILLVLLTQLAIYGVLGVIAFNIPMTRDLLGHYLPQTDVLQLVGPMLGYAVVFFVLGVIIYVSMSAFVGSLASKTEDVQKSLAPVMMIGMVGFYAGMYGVVNPNNLVVKIASYVPFWTPLVMPFRIAGDTVTGVELGIAIAVLIVSTIVIFMVSAMFYRSNVLIYSDTNLVGQIKRSLTILKSERNKK